MRIDIQHLVKSFRRDVRALDDLTLTVPPGMFGLLGANGAGKTTLIRVLAGLLRPTSGRVLIGGYDVATKAGRRDVHRALGYLPQDLAVYPELTAREFLDYLGLLKGIDNPALRRRRVGELLEVVSLSGDADRKLKTYSGGMRRRIGIAQALLADPRLLIVDEPTVGLDPQERIRFRTLLAQLAGQRTVLLSTHIVDDIAQTCRHVAVLSRGRLAFNGTVEALTTHANGRVWTVVTTGPQPTGILVSALPESDGVRYRVVSQTPPPDGQPTNPTLEDGYLSLPDLGVSDRRERRAPRSARDR
jgi:ABC-type multidrug transport system ATPase subunit